MIYHQPESFSYNNSPQSNITAINRHNVQAPPRYSQEMNNPFFVNNPYNSVDNHESLVALNNQNNLGNEKKMHQVYVSNNKEPKYYSSKPEINNGMIDSGNLRLPPVNFSQNSSGKNAISQPKVNYGESANYINYENYSQKEFTNSYKSNPKSPVAFIYNKLLIY